MKEAVVNALMELFPNEHLRSRLHLGTVLSQLAEHPAGAVAALSSLLPGSVSVLDVRAMTDTQLAETVAFARDEQQRRFEFRRQRIESAMPDLRVDDRTHAQIVATLARQEGPAIDRLVEALKAGCQ